MTEHILITGGAGFLGANLTLNLLREHADCYVTVVDNLYTGRLSNLQAVRDNLRFTFIEHDIVKPLPKLPSELPPVTHIYHAACPASPPAYQGEHSIQTMLTCVQGSYHVLQFARSQKTADRPQGARVLLFSTSEVYGDPLVHPQTEDYRGNVNPHGIRSCYDEGKRAAESLFFDFHRLYGLDIKVARIFNTYGPLMDPQDGRVVSNFICQALRGEPLTIYGDGSQTRSFCYVDDLIEGLIALMNSPADFQGPVNLGNPGEFTVKELAELVIREVESGSQLEYRPLPSDDPKLRRPEIALAREKLDWQPRIDLRTGLKSTVTYFRDLNTQVTVGHQERKTL